MSEAAGYAPVWPDYLSRVYRWLCGSGIPDEFKLKIFLLVYEQFLFENETKKAWPHPHYWLIYLTNMYINQHDAILYMYKILAVHNKW